MTKKKEQPEIVRLGDTVASERYEDVYRVLAPDTVVKHLKIHTHLYQFDTANRISLRVGILTADTIRFRYALNGTFPTDFSYALSENFQAGQPKLEFIETKESYSLQTESLRVLIAKERMTIRIEDYSGFVISEDSDGFSARSYILKGLAEIKVSKKAMKSECFFGLGDKASALNLRGRRFENWNTDSFSYTADTDPLYRSIPFYYGLHHNQAYGIFLDNTFRSHFDFDSKNDDNVHISASGGEFNYYFINGPGLLSVAKRYLELTGKPELPPIWALGFHQCRWSYYPESRVMEIAKEFRKRRIPCDAIYLDIDYMDGFRCFTWDKSRFPNPTAMIRNLREKGFKTIVMIDPGLKVDEHYQVFTEAREKDYLCKRPDGDLMVGPVWPSDCVFPDFTNQWARKWWGHLYAELYSKNRVAGFWNDMNEPAVFKINKKTFPEDVRHYYEGQFASHAKAHNIYGMQMSRATYDGLKKLKPHRRPFVITRASYSGGQRFSSVWTGDNVASWEHLQIANRQCQRLSISGFSFAGTDIGGFEGTPDGELFVRWMQLGVFHPLFRVHSMGNHTDGDAEADEIPPEQSPATTILDQEPWSFGETYERHSKYAIELRYQLLPYLYTVFWKYVTENSPMIRSLSFFDQTDENCLMSENEFMLGEHILVSPVVEKGETTKACYLPKGNWYYYWTAEKFEGGKQVSVNAPLSRIPFFIRAGAVVPHYPIRQSTDQHPVDELTLHVYYQPGSQSSQLFEDEGDGYEYTKEGYSLKTFRFEATKQMASLTQNKTGKYQDTYQTVNILFYGIPFEAYSCIADDESIDFRRLDIEGNPVYAVTLGNQFKNILLK